jgi:hypothetical protein
MESASFLPDDPWSLVDASLACPRCLHAVDWHLVPGDVPSARCHCRACGHARSLALTGAQMVRLSLDGGPEHGPPLEYGLGLDAVRRALDRLL